MQNSLTIYNTWQKKATDPEIMAALKAASEEDIARYFTEPLSFGTAGLRGIMTAGPGAMNIYTVRQATRGLAEYILETESTAPSAVIAYDTRINSRRFAKEAASVMAEAGIKVWLFDGARPTPELSYAVRKLGCSAGINITASHNPKEYNGYKVYYADGAQISGAQADAISQKIAETDPFDVPTADFDKAVSDGMIKTPGREFDEDYIAQVLAQQINPDVDKSLGIVYTPLHGAGASIVPELLTKAGYSGVKTVEEQLSPDGTFPTAEKPNPEFREAFALGIELAEKNNAALVLANDPDADRAGAAVRNSDGSFTVLSGNQIGALLLEYILSAYTVTGKMPKSPFAVKSIVSTGLADRICEAYGVKMKNVPTGFKFIGEQMEIAKSTGESFVFGFEESNGYLCGDYARDKDGVLAIMLLCEAAAYYASKDMTLGDAMEAIYKKYGCYREFTENIVEKGVNATEIIAGRMKTLRECPPTELAGQKANFTDYNTEHSPIGKVNMVSIELEDGCKIMVRPSGTEPKMKLYIHVNAKEAAKAAEKAEAVRQAALAMFSK